MTLIWSVEIAFVGIVGKSGVNEFPLTKKERLSCKVDGGSMAE